MPDNSIDPSSVTWDSDPQAQAAQPQQTAEAPAVDASQVTWDQDKYSTIPQQIASVAEGVGKGILGPIAPALELGAGLTTQQAIRGRQAANPGEVGGGEALGLGASAFTGLGEARALGAAGEAAAGLGEAAGIGLEGAGTISRIAAQGIKTGGEMAALQGSDELSKMVSGDPDQTLGSAAVNIGLSSIIGTAGGSVVGAVSPLWTSTMEKMGIPKLIDDAKAQYNFRQGLPNGGDVPSAMTDELTTRMAEVDNMRSQMSNLKGAALERAMPEVTPENTAKIDAQIQDISNNMAQNIEKASDNAYLRGAVPKLAQDFQDFLEVVTDPNATYTDKFDAIDDLKRAQQAKSNYNMTAEDTALGQFTKKTAYDLRVALEDPAVWGDAANVQSKVNAAISSSIGAEKDAASKFTSKLLGERTADPNKVTTLVNQTLKGKAGLKTNVMNNYLENTQDLADTINKIHTDAGLEAPIRLTPTPAINHTLGRSSPGTNVGNWLFEKGLASVAGHGAAEATGAGIGSLIGHPAIGALIGERMLAPTFTAIAKPMLETASKSAAFKGTVDYLGNVIRGGKLLGNATGAFFKAGAEVLPKDLLPNVKDREDLQKSLDSMNSPSTALNIGAGLQHYLPDHATAAATMAARAQQVLMPLKPTEPQGASLDKPTKPNPYSEAQYNRALDIAQQPLVALQKAKNGTLQLQDVQVLKQIYPNLYQRMVSNLSEEMVKAKAEGNQIPYKQRVSLSLLMGQPLDSTLTQPGMAGILMANAPRGAPQAPQGKPKSVSKSTAETMKHGSEMYATPEQARAASRTTGV